jgi:hypothetical protein
MIAVGSCERCTSTLERGDLRCAVCGIPAPVSSASDNKVTARIMRCDECGAAVTYDSSAQAPKCAFCASQMHVESIEDPMEQTQGYLPFFVSPADAREGLRQWLRGRGFFQPADLASSAQLDSLRPIWWVGWVFRVEALVSWSADSNYGRKKASWAPHAGQTDLTFESVLVSASRGLTEAETGKLTSAYDLNSVSEQPSGPPQPVIEQFDVQRSFARDLITQNITALATDSVQRGDIPGHSFRNVRVASLLRSLVTHRFGFPAYVLAYRYKNKPYRVVLHGQDASCVHGKAPISIGKVMLVIALVVLALAILASILSA